jgi:ribose-phosphate pyrophosphokinase
VLKLAYVPYARQDRVCHEGEACSIKVFADLINSLNFDLVIVCDVHSKATLDLLNNVSEIPQVNVIGKHEHLFTNYDYIVCPDHGARNKTIDVANTLKKPVVFASKTRDQKTGKITSSLDFDYSEIPPNKSFLIVDDICDGGRTFIELEKLLRTLKPVTIDLYVTHGIFSKGLKVFSNFGNIYTTDSLGDKTDTAKEFGMYNEKYIHKLTTLTWI